MSGSVSVLVSNMDDAVAAVELARHVERSGFAKVWLAETRTGDMAAIGGVIARETGLEIGTAIVPVYSRSPALLAMMAGTWGTLGGGRPVHLGIGPGGQVIIERWHGVPFDRPLTTIKGTIAILRQALAGEKTAYDGPTRRSTGFSLIEGGHPEVRIYIGAMGPKMRALAAESADGLILTWIAPDALRTLGAEFEAALARAGRSRDECRLVARAYVAVTDDPAEVREAVRREMVEYVNSPPYARYFRSVGYEQEVEDVAAAFHAGDRIASAAAISDRLLDAMLLAGDRASVRARLQDYFAAGADEVMVQPVAPNRGGDPERTIQAVGDLFGDTLTASLSAGSPA
jgi:probable F420-dependent oxidoreductase